MRQAELFISANQLFGDQVAAFTEADWGRTVPATPSWTVRELVNHVARNNCDLLGSLEGSPEMEGDDVLGEDPSRSWSDISAKVVTAVGNQEDPSETVPSPSGEMTIGDLIYLQTADRMLHSWDLSTLDGTPLDLDDKMVQAVYDIVAPHAPDLRSEGQFGTEITVGPDATLLQRLLALTGRDPDYVHSEPDNDPKAQEIHRAS